MKIKSLLIGSAAATVLATGAQAADAIVYADPEPMEYVRICDVYGAGFFYIPGTETCLRVSGYYRFQIDSVARGTNGFSGYGTLARFAPGFDVRSSTEWGTLRGYAEVEFNYGYLGTAGARAAAGVAGPLGDPGNGYYQWTNLLHAFIDIGDRNFLRIGRNWAPYGVWVGPGGNIADGSYGRRIATSLTYYFNVGQPAGIAGGGIAPGAGFSGFISLLDDATLNVGPAPLTPNWSTDVEAGVGYGWSGGFIRASAAYDSSLFPAAGSAWSFKVGAQHAFNPMFTARLTALYNSQPGIANNYSLGTPGAGSRWSVLGGVDVKFSPKAAFVATAQWFNTVAGVTAGTSQRWTAAVGVDLRPVEGLRIRPEIGYRSNQNGTNAWNGVIRMDRTF